MALNYISKDCAKGTINISENVISCIIKNAISEVDGIGGLSNTAGAEIAQMVGLKSFTKGVKVDSNDDSISVDVIITVKYGSNIVDVAEEVQNSVLSSLQSMTGIDNIAVNVHVSGIEF